MKHDSSTALIPICKSSPAMEAFFPAGLTPEEKETLFEIFDITIRQLQPRDWILYGGAHIGSCLIQDLLPWDDDIDILAFSFPEKWEMGRFRAVLTTYGKSGNPQPLWKLFDPARPNIPGKKYSFPFVDVALMAIDGNDVVHSNTAGKIDRFPNEWILPADTGKLNGRTVNLPREDLVLCRKYSPDWAGSAIPLAWSHRTERATHFPRTRTPIGELVSRDKIQPKYQGPEDQAQ